MKNEYLTPKKTMLHSTSTRNQTTLPASLRSSHCPSTTNPLFSPWASCGINNYRSSVSHVTKVMYGVEHHVFQVLVAILPERVISYFDVQSKTWKELSLMEPLTEIQDCYCVEVIDNYLYVAAKSNHKFVIFYYDIICDTWSTLQPIPGSSGIQIGCLCNIEEHLYVIYKSSAPFRYNIATNQWQSIKSSKAVCNLNQNTFCNKAAAVYKSCLYVLYGQGELSRSYYDSCKYFSAQLYCFDPKENVWEQKASTETPHFGSSLLVVKNNLYVAGGDAHSFQQLFSLETIQLPLKFTVNKKMNGLLYNKHTFHQIILVQ